MEITRESSFWFGVGLAERAGGRAELAADNLERASELLTAAFDRFKDLGVPLEVARSHLELAGLAHRTTADDGEAARHLNEALRLFSGLGASRYEARVRELAESIEVEIASPDHEPSPGPS
jgi:hypothetical protein